LLFAALLNRVPDAPPEERKTRSAFEYSDSPRSRRSGTDLTPQSLRFDDLPLWWYCCFDDCLIFSANSSRPSSQGPGQIAPRPSSMVVESNAPPSPSSSRFQPCWDIVCKCISGGFSNKCSSERSLSDLLWTKGRCASQCSRIEKLSVLQARFDHSGRTERSCSNGEMMFSLFSAFLTFLSKGRKRFLVLYVRRVSQSSRTCSITCWRNVENPDCCDVYYYYIHVSK
jgi:hypothetical protein